MEGGDRTDATHAAAFVLVGRRSSRMGRDKAPLPSGSRTLAEQIAHSVRLGLPVTTDAVKGRGPMGGIEPLCAVYHRRLLPALESALEHKQLKMKDFVLQQNPGRWPVADASALRNINTPEEWRQEVA